MISFLEQIFLIDILIRVLKIKYPKIFHVNYFAPIVLIKNNKLKMYNIFSILAKLTMIIEINLLLIFKINGRKLLNQFSTFEIAFNTAKFEKVIRTFSIDFR